MKTIIILTSLLFTCLTAHAKLCEVNKGHEFDFSYVVRNQFIDFSIKRKDGQAFTVYENINLKYPFHLGFSYEDRTSPLLGKVKNLPFIGIPVDINITHEDLDEVFLENNNTFSSFLGPVGGATHDFPIESKNLIITKNYSKQINLKDFVNFFKLSTPWHKKFGKEKILFKVKLIHDSEMKECSSFTTQPISVNIGSFFEFIEQLMTDNFNPPKIKVP